MNEKKLCKILYLATNPYGISYKVTGSFRFCFALSDFVESSH